MPEPKIKIVFAGTLCLNSHISSFVKFDGEDIEYDGTNAGSADVCVKSYDAANKVVDKWTPYGGDSHLTKIGGEFCAKVRLAAIKDEPPGTTTIDHYIVTVENPGGEADTHPTDDKKFIRVDCAS